MIVHGALDHEELAALGLDPARVLDFSSNINPCGPPPRVRQALAAYDPAAYPDRRAWALRERLAQRHGCRPANILIGNGASEAIHLVARLLRPGDRVLVIAPTFGEYAHASRLAGARVVTVVCDEARQFMLDLPACLAAMRTVRPRLVWVCAPNNPTGTLLDEETLHELARASRQQGSLLVIDRAYAGIERVATDMSVDRLPPAGLIRLYSLTKRYALAGLRLGYLVAEEAICTALAALQPPWSVNGAAQVAGLAALEAEAEVTASLAQWWALSDRLRAGLVELGLRVLPSALPFMLVHVGDGAALRAALLQRGCLVRDCASFGLPHLVRVAPRCAADNAVLIRHWSELCRRPS